MRTAKLNKLYFPGLYIGIMLALFITIFYLCFTAQAKALPHPKDQWFVNNHGIRRFYDEQFRIVCYVTDYSVSISCVKIGKE